MTFKNECARYRWAGKPGSPLLRIISVCLALSALVTWTDRALPTDFHPPYGRVFPDQEGSRFAPGLGSPAVTVAQKATKREGPKEPVVEKKGKPGDADKLWRSEELDVLGVGLGIGDVDGDGKNEVVIIDPGNVHLYRFTGEHMSLVDTYTAGTLELKGVDVAKIGERGSARIYVTAQNRGTLASFVLEYRNGKLDPVIRDVPYYLRVIDYPTHGPILLGQQKGLKQIYDGPVYRLADKGNALEVAGRFGVPLKIPIFGFAIGDFEGKRRPLIAAYDREDHLRLYEPSGKRLYLSKDYYGGSDVVIRQEGPTLRPGSPNEEMEKFYFRPRILAMDLDGDSVYEVIVCSHSSRTGRYLSRTRMLEEGQVISLHWNGDALVPTWNTPPTQGMITDFAVNSLPGLPGRRLIVLERKKTDWLSFLRSKSLLKAYLLDTLMAEGLKQEKK